MRPTDPARLAGPAVRRRSRMLWVVVLLGGILHSPTASAAMLGEPMASVPPRQLRFESEIDYSTRDVDMAGFGCCHADQSLRLLVKISGLVHDQVELFGRIGSVVVHTLDVPGGSDIEGSPGFAVGGGLKVTLHQAGAVAWGAGAQILYYDTNDDHLSVHTNWNEIDLFAGPTMTILPGVTAYGGFLGSIIVGNVRGSGVSSDLSEHIPVGFFLGGEAHVTRNWFFGLEMRLLNELSVSSRVGVDF
jgi:hypothetical protein